MKAKWVLPGGWIRTSYLSETWTVDDPTCELCGRMTCGPYWVHIERRVVRCYKCQTEDDLWQAVDDLVRAEEW